MVGRKDPAFLFYTSDFLTGTMFMSNEQVGIYVRLLCAQHQHGGMIDKASFNAMAGADALVRSKFVEAEDGFFNPRLMEEMEKRKAKACNLSANAMVRWSKEKQRQYIGNANASDLNMPIEDENEREVKGVEEHDFIKYPYLRDSRFKDLWDAFVVMRKACKAKPTVKAVELLMKKLHAHPPDVARAMLEQSIENNWKGIFPLKGGKDGKRASGSAAERWAAKHVGPDGRDIRQGREDHRGEPSEPPTD